ncbi:hypothetical protein GE09DRAFT_329062 [Coniochaeta sp. 2T2.1]|nr:hypothetical protein GE09DRAFT_329062 [Coniochaeta sp. 2T2.1]
MGLCLYRYRAAPMLTRKPCPVAFTMMTLLLVMHCLPSRLQPPLATVAPASKSLATPIWSYDGTVSNSPAYGHISCTETPNSQNCYGASLPCPWSLYTRLNRAEESRSGFGEVHMY